MEEDNDKTPLEDLIHIVQILLEEPDKLEKLEKNGAKITRNFFVFTCLGGCGLVYAINSYSGEVYDINHLDSIPETGRIIEDPEEITCIIESLLEFVEDTPDLYVKEEFFMERLNPKKYIPGSCFSPC